jgi:hypothetical protein
MIDNVSIICYDTRFESFNWERKDIGNNERAGRGRVWPAKE